MPVPNEPKILTLSPGTYWWCACKASQDQPWCDGAHRGIGIAPIKLVINEEKEVALCQCKRTNNPPYCDGSHNKLNA